jgi:hypothetical protein
MTVERQCRLVELREEEGGPGNGDLGPASVFVSHCWAGKWGDTVAAATKGASDDRYVWLDAFAVKQWPDNVADLDFAAVIERCSAVVLALPRLSGGREFEPSLEDRKRLFFFRIWCLAELEAARRFERPVLLRCGEMTGDDEEKGMLETDYDTLLGLREWVAVESAEAAFEEDRVRILNDGVLASTPCYPSHSPFATLRACHWDVRRGATPSNVRKTKRKHTACFH